MKKFFILLITIVASLNMIATPVKHYELVNLTPNLIAYYQMNDNGDSIMINNKHLPIYKYLNLQENQKNFFNEIHNDLKTSIDLFSLNGKNYIETFRSHLYHDLQLSKMALDDNQYRKYLRTINVTLVNKNLINDLVDYEMSLKKDNNDVHEN